MLKILTNCILMQLALFILVSYAALSKPISSEEAKEIAMQHNLQMNKYSIELQDPSAYKLIASSHDVFSKATKNPTFYIYNFPQKGWVIVAGDDIARPVLAYSKDASYGLENLHDNAKYWLEVYDLAISEAIKQGTPQSEKIANEWLMARNPKKRTSLLDEVIPPLIKTKWGQESPYNNLCPYDEDEKKRTLTGCVATTMAQIMKYWDFPVNGIGEKTYGHGQYGKLHANFENTTYDWENMTNEYNQNSTKEEIKAVATLMYHCGVALSMEYGVGTSGTEEHYIVSSLKTYFMYDNSIKLIHRSDYDDNTWTNILKKNLDNNQPMPYAGEANAIRHSFICDGYDTDGRFHFNLGWNGNSNGYYYIDGITNLELNLKQNAIINIKPVEEFRPQISLLKPLELKQEIVYQNSTLKINANIINNKSESFSGSISLRLFDAGDNFVMTVAEQEIDNLEPNKPIEITFETDPLFNLYAGKYYVKLYHKHDILNSWLLSSGHNKLVLDVKKTNTGSKLSLYSLPTLSTYQVYKGDSIKAIASFINTSEEDFRGIILASIYDEKGTMIKELASYNVTEAIAPNNYIKDIEFSNIISNLDYGIYFIGFKSKDEGGEFAFVNTNGFISFIKFEIVLPELITDLRLKKWIISNRQQLFGVIVNKDGGITGTITNLEALAKIDSLDCSKSKLVSIDELIKHMPNLKMLKCSYNSLLELDVSKNIKLEKLDCSDNPLINLNISNNIELKYLKCNNNQLINLDISNNIKLEELYCNNNQLTNLNISKNTELTSLTCTLNQLTNLDISKNIRLKKLYCYRNQLTNLDVSKSIELTFLSCSYNKLINLDISKNIKLKELYCNNNQINNLDVTSNINLIRLDCSENQLNKLDVSRSIELTFLKCNHNKLINLDISKNNKLKELHCFNNQLNKLDVTSNINLIQLGCFENKLTNLDVNKNIKLETLHCYKNQLNNLDLSSNIKLKELYCENNQITILDISPLTILTKLNCCNQAKGFILYLTNKQKNRFNEKDYCNAILHYIELPELITDPRLKKWISDNKNKLPKVIVNDDGGIDSTTTNLEALAKVEILDCTNSKLITIDELIIHMPNLKILKCSYNSLVELDVSKNILLEELDCSNNQIKKLDMRKNIKLEKLICWSNKLTNLDLSKNIEIKYLNCSYNELTNLEISRNILLEELDCSTNQIKNLDVSNNINLMYLNCFDNQLTNLEISKNIKLKKLICWSNKLSSLDLSKNIEIKTLYCNNNMLVSLDISLIRNLSQLRCCNQAEGFILYLTNEQMKEFTEKNYCDAILKEKDGSIYEIEWLDIYPNPTVGKFFIVNKFFTDEIKILNLAGEVLYRAILNDEKTEIDISNLPAGLYLVITKGKIGKVIKN